MIALHIGIELTMNMHVFEILSIIGWCMFFIVPDDKGMAATRNENHTNAGSDVLPRFLSCIVQKILNLLLFSVIFILITDSFPLYELYHVLEGVLKVPLATMQSTATSSFVAAVVQVGSSTTTLIQMTLRQLYDLRRTVFYKQLMVPYLYSTLYQEVWNLYNDAPDTNCIYTTNITTYTTNRNINIRDVDDGNDKYSSIRKSYTYTSPDWGKMTWYTKKRHQRPMTMQEKLVPYMCRNCYVQYHAHALMRQAAVNLRQQNENDTTTATMMNVPSIHLASATLTMQCENPPDPPELDDWFNMTGWFFANAKQEVLVQDDPVVLYTVNMCEDLNVELCQLWYNEGLCYHAHNHHNYRHSYNNGTLRLDNDAFVFNITQTCRRSCRLCPEQGYDSDRLPNGTRISIYWPVQSWDDSTQMYTFDPTTSKYFDGTIIEVRERPMKQYLIRYDDSPYNSEWFDPTILRDRGYHLIPVVPEGITSVINPGIDVPPDSVDEDEDDDDIVNYDEDESDGEDDNDDEDNVDDDEVEVENDITAEDSRTRDEL
jgi:hypothetical protein